MNDEFGTIRPYGHGLEEFAGRYESVVFEDVHRGVLPFVPKRPGIVLDVGAGTGRDAAWFAAQGWDVIAAEPSAPMRELAARIHGSQRLRWLDDRLPGLEMVHRLGLTFELIWLSAVWMHVPPPDRPRAFRKLVSLLRPGGRIVVSLRQGGIPSDRVMFPVSSVEIEQLALDHGLMLRALREDVDALGRSDVCWQTVVLEMPGDSTGSLPLLRGIILNDAKSATYKVALLRVIARIADSTAAVSRVVDDETIALPLGLVGLFWLRMFKPLLARQLPQTPTDGQGRGLGFVKGAFHEIAEIPPLELRLGQRFFGGAAGSLGRAIADASRNIADMPATFLKFADGRPVFPTICERRPKIGASLILEPGTLWQFGELRVPRHLWDSVRRLSVWIEPMLCAEWARLIRSYAMRQGRSVSADEVEAALRWVDPDRDTNFVREIAGRLISGGTPIFCVWSGERLSEHTMDIDHCFPWTAWPCSDLWNLMPASRRVNQHQKRDRLVSAATLRASQPRIMDWWQAAYDKGAAESTRFRFEEEARGTLFTAAADAQSNLCGIFDGVDYQRLRLRQDQQLPEWTAEVTRR